MERPENRSWDWLVVLLLVAALSITAYRLTDTKWTDHLNMTVSLTWVGMILGLLLGYSQFKAGSVKIFGIAFTLFFPIHQLLLTTPIEFTWSERLGILGERIRTSTVLFIANQPLNDSILFISLLALIFWLNALTSGYLLARYRKPWSGLIIAGITMIAIDIYHPVLAQSGFASALFAILALVISTRINYINKSRDWQTERASVDSDTGSNLIRVALISTIILVVLAWNAPRVVRAFVPNTPERERLLENWQGVRQRLQNATASLRGSVPIEVEFFGEFFGLGTGTSLTEETIFTVSPNIPKYGGASFYWRLRSYDSYSTGQWSNTIQDEAVLKPGEQVAPFSQYDHRVTREFIFRPVRNLGMLYAPGLMLQSDLPTSLIVDRNEEQINDIVVVLVDEMVRPGTEYTLSASLAAPNLAELRAAGTEYPDWVVEKYLQLPENMPARISTLAREITSGALTPYDQAAAITVWLRTNIEYSTTIPTPPPNIDPVEWVLFEQKQAFCNYYASAEVLMLRSLGVPARWVVGYAQGELVNSDTESYYRVRDMDRHAWPEVFFPGLGWVEFEPTASQPEILRPIGDPSDDSGSLGNNRPAPLLEDDAPIRPETTPFTTTAPGTYSNRILFSMAVLFGGLLGLVLIAWAILRFIARKKDSKKPLAVLLEKQIQSHGWKVPRLVTEWALYSQLSPIERTFYRVKYIQLILGIPHPRGLTPAEQMYAIAARLPEGKESAAVLLREYENGIYSLHPADVIQAQAAVWDLWIKALKKRLQIIRNKIIPAQT